MSAPPPRASEKARRVWSAPLSEKLDLLLHPDPETARMFIEIGFENFTVRDLETAVREQVDVIPLMSQWLHLEDMGIRPFARMAIRAWWREILDAAMHPMSVLESIRQQEPAKAAVLDTPEGRMWFNATLYNLIMWLRAFGKIKGDRVLLPPPLMPERLIRRELPPPGA